MSLFEVISISLYSSHNKVSSILILLILILLYILFF